MDASTLAAAACVVAVLAVLLALVALRQPVRTRRGGAAHPAEPGRAGPLAAEVAALRDRVDAVDGRTATGPRHVAVVRYDEITLTPGEQQAIEAARRDA